MEYAECITSTPIVNNPNPFYPVGTVRTGDDPVYPQEERNKGRDSNLISGLHTLLMYIIYSL